MPPPSQRQPRRKCPIRQQAFAEHLLQKHDCTLLVRCPTALQLLQLLQRLARHLHRDLHPRIIAAYSILLPVAVPRDHCSCPPIHGALDLGPDPDHGFGAVGETDAGAAVGGRE